MRVLALNNALKCTQQNNNAATRSLCTPLATKFTLQAPHLGYKLAVDAKGTNSLEYSQSIISCAAAGTNGTNGSTTAVAEAGTSPSAAETARTVVDLVAHGTLCTVGEDGIPLGTYVSYVLDAEGQPILRLRSDAVHTANLQRDTQCSLFVQPGEYPARLLARVTLIGKVEPVPEEVAATAAELHNTLHAGGVGVDAPQDSDIYCRLLVDKCFYVGQLSGNSAADVISGSEYREAEADPLRTIASNLVEQMNSNRLEDVMRISSHALSVPFEDLYFSELLWVDRLGAYLKAVGQDGSSKTLRVPFAREVEDDRGVQSALTMMAQYSWEIERPYNPVAVPIPAVASTD
ncbi:putative Glutamyl-tRNA reductase-binding protein, chloroplastic [Nannochloris sp. 'desiccata']|nr:putative Glutamyl-tRNA reductase-binding protein, chloroplastic [Chlorella desiccata (nom. nud.)]